MNPTVSMYTLYLLLGVALTVWVARTLHKNGRIFLVDAFRGNEALADSVNHLLVVGFYLVNAGFIALFLRNSSRPENPQEIMEMLSSKMGVVLLVLGGMHFFNLLIFSKMRRRGMQALVPPPVPAVPRPET